VYVAAEGLGDLSESAGPPAEYTASDPPAAPLGGPICERPKLTGDWVGFRTSLQDNGITFDLSTTQFYQGVASGGL
jgi:hypothetical protein